MTKIRSELAQLDPSPDFVGLSSIFPNILWGIFLKLLGFLTPYTTQGYALEAELQRNH